MTEEQKEKLKDRIKSGQSVEMLSWEFKLRKSHIVNFAKEHNLILRTGDHIRYANKIFSKMK